MGIRPGISAEGRPLQGAGGAGGGGDRQRARGAAPAGVRPAPPRITLAVDAVDAGARALAVDLRVRVPAGLGVPARFRLRRSLSQAHQVHEAHRMPVVAEGEVPAAGPLVAPLVALRCGAEWTEILLRDEGLTPWRVVSWAVEVQSSSQPGSWSAASAPASSAVIPGAAPGAPSAVIAARSGGEIALLIQHPEGASLINTPMGPHVFEIYRAAEGRPERVELPVRRTDDTTFATIDPAPPMGAAIYAVRVVDPLGRPGCFATSISV